MGAKNTPAHNIKKRAFAFCELYATMLLSKKHDSVGNTVDVVSHLLSNIVFYVCVCVRLEMSTQPRKQKPEIQNVAKM